MFTYDFIEKIGKINIKYSKKCRREYLTFIEEFTTTAEYNEKLDTYLGEFRKEILNLPFLLSTKQSRKTFLNNLHDEFLLAEELLKTQFEQAINESYECISIQKKNFKFYVPRYCQKQYINKARVAYSKMHIAFALQKDKIEIAVITLNSIAMNDGIELKTINNDSDERIQTTLSSPELAFLSFVILQKVAKNKDFNRSHLSRILADNFSTKKTTSPQANQLRKHFTEVNDNVQSKVEKLFIELSRTCISEHL